MNGDIYSGRLRNKIKKLNLEGRMGEKEKSGKNRKTIEKMGKKGRKREEMMGIVVKMREIQPYYSLTTT